MDVRPAGVPAFEVFDVGLAPDLGVAVAAGLVWGRDRERRLRLVANSAAQGRTVVKSNVDGIGSGSCFSVP